MPEIPHSNMSKLQKIYAGRVQNLLMMMQTTPMERPFWYHWAGGTGPFRPFV